MMRLAAASRSKIWRADSGADAAAALAAAPPAVGAASFSASSASSCVSCASAAINGQSGQVMEAATLDVMASGGGRRAAAAAVLRPTCGQLYRPCHSSQLCRGAEAGALQLVAQTGVQGQPLDGQAAPRRCFHCKIVVLVQ